MSTNRNLLTSPVGTIQFMAAEKQVKQSKKSDKLVYTIKLAFDVKKDKEFLDTIAAINKVKVVTAKSYRGEVQEVMDLLATGKALISANSNYKPEVYDHNGNKYEEAPMFFGESTGTAQMIVQPWEGEEGGTINLVGIIVHTIENPEGTGEVKDRATRVAELDALVKANTKK